MPAHHAAPQSRPGAICRCRAPRLHAAPRARPTAPRAAPTTSDPLPECADVVVIGAGLGGLSCAALLAKYGLSVAVLEAHDAIGGAAHAFRRGGYAFESGPSLFSGMATSGPGANPMSHVLSAVGASLPLKTYDDWLLRLPGLPPLRAGVGGTAFDGLLAAACPGDAAALAEWRHLQSVMAPLARAATAVPAVALRGDAGAALTAGLRCLPRIAASLPDLPAMARPFSDVVNAHVRTPFTRRWLDLLCFLLSGLPADGTPTAEMAFMFAEWYRPGSTLEFPIGGASAIAGALAGAVRGKGGTVTTRARVAAVTTDAAGRAAGVTLTDGRTIAARKAVVSNASAVDTAALASAVEGPASEAAAALTAAAAATPQLRSFMHVHVGFDAAGLDVLDVHCLDVASWDQGVDADHAVSLISVPSVLDPAMAPPGRHCLHAYHPATEPFEPWEGVKRGSAEYERLKEERAADLIAAVERFIPDVRARADVFMVGTPLTHARYLNRHLGAYGPAWPAGRGFPGAATGIQGLYRVGDYAFPGVGVPAVAASGAVAASTIAGLGKHWQLLNELGL